MPVNCTATGIRTVIGSRGSCIVSSDEIRCGDLRDIGDAFGFLSGLVTKQTGGEGGCDGCSATGCDYRLKPPENEPASSTPPPVFLRHPSGAIRRHCKTKAKNESQSRKSSAENWRETKPLRPFPAPSLK